MNSTDLVCFVYALISVDLMIIAQKDVDLRITCNFFIKNLFFVNTVDCDDGFLSLFKAYFDQFEWIR